MMILDTITIVVCIALLVLAVVSSVVFNPFRRKPKEGDTNVEPKEWPRFSIVIPVHDNAAELERILPIVLSQDYGWGYEVIVIDESSTDETDDVLTRLKQRYPHLYVTFIPDSSHYLSRRKLSITLGVKASRYEWIVFTTADSCPASDQWLKSMACHCKEGIDMVLGYTSFSDESKVFYRFERLLTACRQFRKASKDTAYAYEGRNLAVRKNLFTDNNGFIQNLKYLRGEYDFIVNEYAEKGCVAIATEPEARMVQDAPSKKTWTSAHLFYMETRKHLARSLSYRLLNNTDTALLHANYVVQACVLAASIALQSWVVTAMAGSCLVLTIALRMFFASRAISLFGESIPLWCVPWMELRVMWQRLLFMMKYRTSDKHDYIRR